MGKRLTAMLLCLALGCPLLSVSAAAAESDRAFTPDNPTPPAVEAPVEPEATPVEPEVPAEDAVGTVSYANLEKRVRENNPTVRMLQENIEYINDIDYEKMYDKLRDNLALSAKMRWGLLQSSLMNPATEAGNTYISNSLSSSTSSARDAFEDLKSGQLQKDNEAAKRQLENTQEQVIMGAETLYIAILEMQNTRSGLQRQLDALDRSLAEMEIRQKYGQISALTMQQVQNGRTQLASGIATLDMNLANCLCQLEVMLGLSPTGTLTLSEIPEITDEQIAEMAALEDALAVTKEKSYELYEAQKTLDEAEETYRDTKNTGGGLQSMEYKQAVHAYDAAKYTYQATIQNFELSFRSMYAAVADYRQILTAAESALEYQRSDYAASQLKYQHGTISQNALLEAQDALATAETAVLTAKHNLFTAYHNYQLAVEHGILN